MEFFVSELGIEAHAARPSRSRSADRRSRKHRRIEPYAWLTASAVTVGIGAAAFTGTAVAHADDAAGKSAATSSTAAKSESAAQAQSTEGPEKSDLSSTAAAKNRTTKTHSGAESVAGDDDSTAETSTDGNSSDIEDTDTDQDTDQLGSDNEPTPIAKDSEDTKPRASRLDARTDSDPVPASTAETVDKTANADLEVQVTEDVAEPSTDSSGVTAPAAQSPAAPASTASDSPAADATDSDAQISTSMSLMCAQSTTPSAPAAPKTLADLIRAFFVSLQTTWTPTAGPVQKSGQSNQTVATSSVVPGVVTGTVPGVATSTPDAPVTVKLSAAPKKGSVQVSADGKYTYTPSAALAASGGTDTFSVTITTPKAPETGLKALWSRLIQTLTFGLAKPATTTTVTKTVTVIVLKTAGDDIEDPAPPTTPPPVSTLPPSKIDAGLSDPFQMPTASTGKTLNVRDYGATSGKSSDNDSTAIQKAINAAQAGDTVYIPDGTYHLKSTINLKSGVSLLGQSREGTVLAGAFFTSPHAVIYGAPNVTDLTLSSFKITRASGASIKAAVRLGNEGKTVVSHIVVKDLFIEKFQRFGILLQNAYQVLVEGNIIRNATALDGGGSGYGITIDQSLSSNNWIRDNEIGPVIRHAILVQFSAHHNLIELNRITGTVSGAIDLHGEDEYSNEIRYNTISNGVRNGTTVSPNGAGIEIGEYSGRIGTTTMHDNSGANNWIHHNVVYGYSMGLRIVNNSNHTYIENNTFYDNLGSGILADLAPLNNLHITGNVIYNNGNGITLNDVTAAVLKDNTIRDNANYGIRTNAGVTGYIITGNTVTNNRVDVSLGSQNGTYSGSV
jgi:hypothetical protein